MISFGRKRPTTYPPNTGVAEIAQRRLAEQVGRAAERTRIAVSVDAHPCRVWLRNPRGALRCPCSEHATDRNSVFSNHDVSILLPPGDGTEIQAPDDGYARERLPSDVNEDLPSSLDVQVADFARWLLGNGRRCGLCWGTGWLDGHRLWGGTRVVCCAVDTPQASLINDSGLLVDVGSETPTFVGPGHVVWAVELSPWVNILDVIRVREGLLPAQGDFALLVRDNSAADWQALEHYFGLTAPSSATKIKPPPYLELKLVCGRNVRVSHIELVLRSEPLINLQLPQLQQAVSQELIAPIFSGEFELDPVVGSLERGSLLEVPSKFIRFGSVWVVTDVTVKQSAVGQIFGVTGNVRYAQPTETIIAALLDDSNVGLIDPGISTRGLEATNAGLAAGLVADPPNSQHDAVIGSNPRRAGGSANLAKGPIILSSGSPLEQDLP